MTPIALRKVKTSVFSILSLTTLGALLAVSVAPDRPRRGREAKYLTTISDDKHPLRIFIVKDVELEKKSKKMSTWLTPKDIKQSIIPEINRI